MSKVVIGGDKRGRVGGVSAQLTQKPPKECRALREEAVKMLLSQCRVETHVNGVRRSGLNIDALVIGNALTRKRSWCSIPLSKCA